MPQQHPKLTRACAELIRLWHERHGIERASSHMNEGQFFRYQERVDHFHRADLSDPAAQHDIAREQQSRAFEWAYVETVPTELWKDVTRTHDVFHHPPPEHLGAAAGWILDILRGLDVAEPSQDEKSRVIVEADSRVRLLDEAREFYADVVAEQEPGIGGLNVLISCSLERYPWDGANQRHATLLRPEVLGLRVVVAGERPDDFIDAIRQGHLVVETTIGGPTEPFDRPGRVDESDGER